MPRLRKGMKIEEIESAQISNDPFHLPESLGEAPFSLHEYLAQLVLHDPHDINSIVNLPIGTGKQKQSVEKDAWVYESLRRLCLDLTNPWITSIQTQCSRQSCNEMRGGEWIYMCAAHASANETECCAIDYIEHTLDATSALLNSVKYFPSRLNFSPTSEKHFVSISRRLYRIFSHAYYHHNELFQACEAETSLYSRFKKLMQTYDLLSSELLAVPASYDLDPTQAEEQEQPRQIMRNDHRNEPQVEEPSALDSASVTEEVQVDNDEVVRIST